MGEARHSQRQTMRNTLWILGFLLAATAAARAALALDVSAVPARGTFTERILYRFKGAADGSHPQSGVIRDTAGHLYGTASGSEVDSQGGCTDCGTVFEMSPRHRQLRTLHTFSGGTQDGAYPTAGLALDRAGNLWGTTENGGGGCITRYLIGCGTVFEISAQTHTETVAESFTGAGGWAPDGGLLLGRTGNLYGTTVSGSCRGGRYGCGTVFEIMTGRAQVIVLHTFARRHGIDGPHGRLAMDRAGNLYVATSADGCLPGEVCGAVYEIIASSHDTRMLHSFSAASDGSHQNGGLVVDRNGNVYGTTQMGGGFCDAGNSPGIDAMGCGTVFEISAATGKETILYRFKGENDGMYPRGGLAADRAGNLYGTTSGGGERCRSGCGTVFEIVAHTHRKLTLYRFKGVPDGESPHGELTLDSAGDLYGTTFGGGVNCPRTIVPGLGCGTVYELIRHPRTATPAPPR
jgi:uncharacterized repeat protein (TIGR03803 family)